jgi:hypothetical protein
LRARSARRLSTFRPAFVQLLSRFCPAFVQPLLGTGAVMEGKFQDVLNSVTAKPGRSRLEPYAGLVDELRSQGFTCRDIVAVLADKCHFQTSKTAVNNFMRAQKRKQRNAVRKFARRGVVATSVGSRLASPNSVQGRSDDEVRRRIAAMKARKPPTEAPTDAFHYDPDEPLRLINPGKRESRD